MLSHGENNVNENVEINDGTPSSSNFKKYLATATEACLGAVAAKLVGMFVKNLFQDYWLNYLISGGIISLTGGLVFAVAATLIIYGDEYLKQKDETNAVSFSQFMTNNFKEAAKFFSSIFLVGGLAFTTYILTGGLPVSDVFGGYNTPMQFIGALVGFLVFTIGNCLPTLNLPIQKLAEVFAVFMGFATGNSIVMDIIADHLQSEETLNQVLAFLTPILSATIAPVIVSTAKETAEAVGKLVDNSKKLNCCFFASGNDNNEDEIQTLLVNDSATTAPNEKRFCCC